MSPPIVAVSEETFLITLALKSSLLNAKSKTNQLREFQDTLAKIQAKVQKRSTMLMTQSVINQIKKQHEPYTYSGL